MMYHFLSPPDLIPTEETDPDRVSDVQSQIMAAGRWTVPIMIEKHALFVMDGHHRLQVAIRLGLVAIPSVLLDYQTVKVAAWRSGERITPDDIYEMARQRRKFPIKTTRHFYAGDLPVCDVPLSELRRGSIVSEIGPAEKLFA